MMNEETMMADKWGWYNSIYILAGECIDKIEGVTKLGLRNCLTFMSYMQDVDRIKTQQQELEMRKHGR
tara:strand:+ start:4574 stop:4777 length:204 start_codon:yes stop_codon:yes gene_type:complete